jgi:hypothetical protein
VRDCTIRNIAGVADNDGDSQGTVFRDAA